MKKSLGAKPWMYPTPVMAIGSYDDSGKPNIMTASWGGVCCSQPPCVAVSIRKATVSYENLMHQKAFTISIPTEKYVNQIDYAGLVSAHTTDKFSATKLTPVKSKLVNAPFIKEFPFVMECRLIDMIELGMHTQFIGEVLDVKAEEEVLGNSGTVDITRLRPLIYTPDTQEYYGIGKFVANVFTAGKSI